jgi:hypothetical protein
MLPNPKGFIKFFLKFQAPNIIPSCFHSFKNTIKIQFTFLLSTIYQDQSFFSSQRRLWEHVFSIFKSKIMSKKEKPPMIQIRPFKEKEKEGGERRSQLSDQWKVPLFGCPWKVPLLSGPRKVPLLGGQWKEKEKHLFISSHFPPYKFYLNPHFFH